MIRSRPEKFFTSSNSTVVISPFQVIAAAGYPGQRQRRSAPRDIELFVQFFPSCSATALASRGLSRVVHFCTLREPTSVALPFRKQSVRCKFLLALALRFACLRKFSMDLENIRLLTLSEAAILLQVSTRTLQRMIRNGQLPAFKVGGQWRLRETQLRQWVENRETAVVKLEKESREI
jgi:excisionase family DNA binding protein